MNLVQVEPSHIFRRLWGRLIDPNSVPAAGLATYQLLDGFLVLEIFIIIFAFYYIVVGINFPFILSTLPYLHRYPLCR